MTQTARVTLDEFLLERIAEDVDMLTRPESFQHSSHGYDSPGTYSPTCRTCRQFVWGTRDRALAECEARRRRVKALNERAPHPNAVPLLRKLLALEALPYADHPDYREEWRI